MTEYEVKPAKIRNESTERTKHAWHPMYWVFMTTSYDKIR